MSRAAIWLTVVGLIVTCGPRPVQAGQAGAPAESAGASAPLDLPFAFDGPAPPAPPEVVSRDTSGRVTIRAVRLTSPLRIDGQLDESLYTSVPPISDFIQMEPQAGEPATEKTELWLAFDRDNVYVSFRCWETHPERVIANEMRRDNNNMWNGNDIVAFVFDTFYDRRNAFEFTANAIGGRSDGQATNERQYNSDFNPVWNVKAARFDRGWTVEAAIPFKSLRYRPGAIANLGLQRVPDQPVEERALVPHPHAAWPRPVGAPADVAGRRWSELRRPRVEEPGDQAVRHRQPDKRSERATTPLERSGRRCRR